MRSKFIIFLYLLVHTIILLKPPGTQAENPEWMYFHDIKYPYNITAIENYIYLTTDNSHVIRLSLDNLKIDTIAKDPYVSSFVQDNDKNIWISSVSSGIYKYSNGNLENFTASNSGLPDNRVYDLAIDTDNNLWSATRQGLAKFDGSNWDVYHFEQINPDGYFLNIVIDKLGSIWGITTYSPFVITQFINSEFIPFNGGNTGIQSIHWPRDMDFDSKGNKWIAAGNLYSDSLGGLIKYDGNYWSLYDKHNSEIADHQFGAIAVDSNDIIWTGSYYSGLYRFDGENWLNLNSSNSGLTADDVRFISVDKYNNKWIYCRSDAQRKRVLEVYNEGGILLPSSANIAIETLKNKKPSIYPNPASEIITVSDILKRKRNFTITNILGQEMLSGEFYHDIDISKLPKGYYFLHLEQFHLSFFKI